MGPTYGISLLLSRPTLDGGNIDPNPEPHSAREKMAQHDQPNRESGGSTPQD
jgi:hypothetical protein